jgi:hypothetical protein
VLGAVTIDAWTRDDVAGAAAAAASAVAVAVASGALSGPAARSAAVKPPTIRLTLTARLLTAAATVA